VGPVRCATESLPVLPNVHVLGFREYRDIPRYGSGFDVGIMPWAPIEWIRWCNPIKLKEYLALGLPVVSTTFPEVERYRDVVSVTGSPELFVREVRRALENRGDDDRRRRRVREDTWGRKADELLAILGLAPAGGVTAPAVGARAGAAEPQGVLKPVLSPR